jgi:predicted DNA-binding transcriptional regulator YafY
MSKADHMLSILWMLKQRRRTAAELAEALEISVRSVYRYIDALCASGVPLIAGAFYRSSPVLRGPGTARFGASRRLRQGYRLSLHRSAESCHRQAQALQ